MDVRIDAEHKHHDGYSSSIKGSLYHAFLRKATDRVALLDEADSFDKDDDDLDPKTAFREFFSSWTVHGPSRIVGNKYWIGSFLWLIIWLCAVVYCVMQCYSVVVLYLTFPKIVTVDLVETENITFPAVTLCSLNSFVNTGDDFVDGDLWFYFQEIERVHIETDCTGYQSSDVLGYFDMYYGAPACYSPDCYSYGYNPYYYNYGYYGYYDYSYYNYYNYYSPRDYSDYTDSNESVPSYGLYSNMYSQAYNYDYNYDFQSWFYYPSYGYPYDYASSYDMHWSWAQYTDLLYPENDQEIYEMFTEDPDTIEYYYWFQDNTNQTFYQYLNQWFPDPEETDDPAFKSTETEAEQAKQRHDARMACSKTYQRLFYEKNPTDLLDTIVENIGTDNCEHDDLGEESLYSPTCAAPFIRDKFGTYNTLLIECDAEKMKGKHYTCTNCCSKNQEFECVSLVDYEYDKHVALSLSKLEAIINNSRTIDGTDLFGRFAEKEEDVEKVAVAVEKFLITCSFDGNPCSYRDFYKWISDKYGYCYTFNSANFYKKTDEKSKGFLSPVRITHNVGPRNGLRITANLHTNDILSFLSPEIGLKVIVHEPDTLPFPEEEGITVLPGVISSVKISQRYIVRQEPPVGSCEYYNLTGTLEYTTTLCRKLCIDQQYRLRCNCTTGKSPAYKLLDVSGKTYQPCSLLDTYTEFCLATVDFDYRTNLKCNCPERCEEWEYKTTVATSKANKKYFTILQNIKETKIADDVCTGDDSSTARVHIYVDRNGYEKIQEVPAYTWETLLSNIGGTFGLFIGLSVVSVLEFMEYLLGLVVLTYLKRNGSLPKKMKKRTHVPVYLMFEPPSDIQKFADADMKKCFAG